MNSSRHSKDSLPPNFIRALRALFDILDSERSGFIRYAEIAARWSDNPPNVNGIPPNFLECLRRVTPPNGMLTFERFCSGLRLSLLETKQMKNNNNRLAADQNNPNSFFKPVYQERVQSDPNLAKSAGLSGSQGSSSPSRNQSQRGSGIIGRPLGRQQAQISWRKAYGSQPAIANSSHHSSSSNEENLYENYENLQGQRKMPSKFSSHNVREGVPPPRYHPKAPAQLPPPYAVRAHRYEKKMSPPLQASNGGGNLPRRQSGVNGSNAVNGNNGVSHATYRNGVPPNPPPGPTVGGLREGTQPPRVELPRERPVSSVDYEKSIVVPPGGDDGGSDRVVWRNKSNLTVVNDSRRHTVSEGVVDSHISKHEKILIEEKEIISRGLEVATRLRNWYNERLSSMETRQKYVNKGMVPLDYAVHEQKMNYLRAHVTEVNRRMTSLMESSERGFPSYVNYEQRSNIPQPTDDRIMWMKKQNESLTDEVAEKTARILSLEKELSSIRRSYVQHRTESAARRSNSPALTSSSRSSQSVSPLLTNGHAPIHHVTNGQAPSNHVTYGQVPSNNVGHAPSNHVNGHAAHRAVSNGHTRTNGHVNNGFGQSGGAVGSRGDIYASHVRMNAARPASDVLATLI